ncbi:hypothetical protein ALI22I_11775 [Saccharothrix sp. ALI-22-I]|uniref:DUF998 domain-containing protein n=1 Tax=Saccharothrix sp. ALI-22-I TaxID=1933778 RepID=UPI00097C45B0|nr:DUF998 domain-containing protein [Saccharothrix sp. ALI-22-I]ONI90419.1 hypothetical protein ALI22I_11775 [Saccharothrix sp. ALI-22-I]
MTTPHTTRTNTNTDTTKLLLGCGVLAGPLYLVTGFALAFTREGFDMTVHPLSFLSLGEGGWVQITNFVLSGLLFLAAAIGLRRTGKVGTWVPVLIGIFAIGMIGGGVFVADPAFGFPAGAPEGQPAELSWHGVLHGVSFFACFPALVASFFVLARKLNGPWARASVVAGVLSLVPMPFMGTEFGVVLLYGAAVVAWLWASAVMAKLRSEI